MVPAGGTKRGGGGQARIFSLAKFSVGFEELNLSERKMLHTSVAAIRLLRSISAAYAHTHKHTHRAEQRRKI